MEYLLRKLKSPGDEPARALAMPEINARPEQFINGWPQYGSGDHLADDSTVGLAVYMHEQNKLRHVPVDACPTMSREVSAVPPK